MFKKIAFVFAVAALAVGVGASSASAYMFNTDLTLGSTGPDVVALQGVLTSGGYLTIPAGVPMGTFGPLTQAAVSKWQTAVGITPAAGYVGPISRAKLNGAAPAVGGGTLPAGCASTAGFSSITGVKCDSASTLPAGCTPGAMFSSINGEKCVAGSTGTGLGGGEASLEDYEIESEESNGNEGETGVEIATASFDVEDADASIERVEIDFQAESSADSTRPWDYFDSISILVNGEEVDSMDVNSRTDWDENSDDDDHDAASNDDWYRLTFTGLDEVVKEGETAEITIVADIAGTIDGSDLDTQEFTVLIPEDGIRATDGEGIQQYTGSYSETVTDFSFDAEESGDLDIESSSNDPDTMTLISDSSDESEPFTVFAFDIQNNDDADSLITDITLQVATSSGDAITDIFDEVTLSVGGDEFDGDVNGDGSVVFEDIDVEIGGDDTLEFEVIAILKSGAPESTVEFSIVAADVDAEGVDSGDEADVSGDATGETHTVSAAGIEVQGTGKSTGISEDGDTGTFTLEFTVEALEENVYIYNGALDASFSASTSGMFYNIYKGGTLQTATTTDSPVLQSEADTAGLNDTWFIVRPNDGPVEFTLTVSLNPDAVASALYSVELDTIRFDDVADTTANDTSHELPNDAEFETSARQID